MARLTDDDLLAICENEIRSAAGRSDGELASERAFAMDRYLGEPYGDEQEGRSQVLSRDTLDTIESIMPQLMRIFADADNLADFEPVGPEDEEAAEQESDRVNHEFWKQNRGFYNLYTFCKDALLSKTGIWKISWEDGKDEREEYQNLTLPELTVLLNDTAAEREVIEWDDTAEGFAVTFITRAKSGRAHIECVTPEEFGINGDARSPYCEDATFVFQRCRKTYGDLRAMGVKDSVIDSLPASDDLETEERRARRHLEDESDILSGESHKRMRTYWVTECYLRIDRDGDGVEEIVRVLLGGGEYGSGNILIETEEVDAIPFFTAAPVLLTHKFFGLSIADLVADIERIKTTLVRQVLDNTYLANNIRTHINENVNIDDMLTRRPGSIARHEGRSNPSQNMAPEPFMPLPPQTFELLNYLDEMRKDRTGSADDVAGLDASSLANVNSSVAAIAYDQARARIELIARIIAEVGIRPALLRIHELLQKKQDKSEVIRLRGKWVEVNPSEWRTRSDMTVKVGLGITSRERRLMALEDVQNRHAALIQAGGMNQLILPEHVYQAEVDKAEALGLEGSRYFQDPRMLPPQQPEGPSIQDQAMMMTAQAQLGAAQAQREKNQVELLKAQLDKQIKRLELAGEQREQAMRAQIEGLKNTREELKSQRDQAEKRGKNVLDFEVKSRDQELRAAEIRLKDMQEQHKRESEILRSVIQSGTALTQEQLRLMGVQVESPEDRTEALMRDSVSGIAEAMRAEMGELKAMMLESAERSRAPREVRRDPKTNLIVAIGDAVVNRDESGRVQSIG